MRPPHLLPGRLGPWAAPAAALAGLLLAAPPTAGADPRQLSAEPRTRLHPLFATALRDTSVCRGGDGAWYLTGTGTDEAYTGRAIIFRSRNLLDWEPVAIGFDFLTIPGVDAEDYYLRFEAPGAAAKLYSKYMDSEIYHLAGTFHLFTSFYGLGAIKKADGSTPWSGPVWLRSTTGLPTGPYAYVAASRAQASVFVADGGAPYLFYNGSLLPFDPTGNTLTGTATKLTTTAGTRFSKGDVATNLAKIHGKYLVFATGWCGGTTGENYRIDGTYDWVYWQSDISHSPRCICPHIS